MKILIIKPSSFGDIAQASPVLSALKKAYPDSNISWLVFEDYAELVSMFADNDNIIIWHKKGGIKEFIKLIKLIRKEKFDLVIDLQGLARTSILSFLSGAKQKISVPGVKEGGYLIVKEVFPKSRNLNATQRSLETVRYLTGEKTSAEFNIKLNGVMRQQAEKLLLDRNVKPKNKIIGIVPSSRALNKILPAEYYIKLFDLISSSGIKANVIILGGENDSNNLKHPSVKNLCGKTSMGQLAAILKRCSVVIGGDTGPVHLAAALGVPVIAIFGGSDVKETAPLTPDTIILTKNYPCSPCRSRPKCSDYPCLKAIKPEEVFAALCRIMKVK